MAEEIQGLEAIESIFGEARRQWPELDLSAAELRDDLVSRCVDYLHLSPALALDVYLASGCLHGSPSAYRVFHARHVAVISAIARRFNPSSAFADEIVQQIHEILFVAPPGQEPRISQYTGEGALSSFVATAAHRIATRLSGHSKRFRCDEAIVDQLVAVDNQETLFLKAHYLRALNTFLLTAVRGVDRRGRVLLRLNLVEKLSTVKLAKMYNVNQSTISRRIHHALRDIFASVKEQACTELGLDTQGFTSALELVRSQLELRLSETHVSTKA